MLLVFIVSYGFLGIEYVSIELDDPFGDDPSDMPIEDEAVNVYDDVAIVLMDVDGMEVAKDLRRRMQKVAPNRNGQNETDSLLVTGGM